MISNAFVDDKIEVKKMDVRCPCCKALLMKLLNCLSGSRFIEIKCRKCKQVVIVP